MYMVIYYQPSHSIVDYLEKELRSLQAGTQLSDAGGKSVVYKRAKEGRTKVAKAKYDAIEHIFQAFADMVYFLEFIEDHEELRAIYDKELKDLFGINEEPEIIIEDKAFASNEDPEIVIKDQETGKYHYKKRKHHYLNRGGPFSRLLAASLFYHVPGRQKLDFRMEFINIVLNYAIPAMQRRIENVDEEKLMSQDASRVLIWSKLLAEKVQNGKNNKASRSLGFHPYKIPSI
jgi:hypothetical protein